MAKDTDIQADNATKIILIISIFTLLQVIILLLFKYTPYPDSESYFFLAKECIKYNDIYPAKEIINQYPFIWNIGSINITILALKLFKSIIPLLILFLFYIINYNIFI